MTRGRLLFLAVGAVFLMGTPVAKAVPPAVRASVQDVVFPSEWRRHHWGRYGHYNQRRRERARREERSR